MKATRFFALLAAAATLGTACETTETPGEDDKGNKPDTTTIELSVDNDLPSIEEQITFTVTHNGEDVTAQSTIYNAADNSVVSNPYTTPSETCSLEFYAQWGFYESDRISVEVSTGDNFNHRVLLVDHSGTNCPNCPRMMAALKALSEDSKYHRRYNEVVCHTYNSSDPASSTDAYTISNYYRTNIDPSFGYPRLFFNFCHMESASGGQTPAIGRDNIIKEIDKLWKVAADAGIKASSTFEGDNLVVDVEVTSKKEQEYRVAVWLLEDGISARQNGGYEPWMNTHNNAVRRISAGSAEDLSGESLGTIAVDGVATKKISLEVNSGWKRENLKALIIVSAPNAVGGKYEVVNTALCPAAGSVDYEYR